MTKDYINLVKEFALNFYGYGNLDAPFWFIGLDETGAMSFEGLQKQALCWTNFNTSTVCMHDFGKKMEELYQEDLKRPFLEQYLRQVCHMLHVAQRKDFNEKELKDYLDGKIGCHQAPCALLELGLSKSIASLGETSKDAILRERMLTLKKLIQEKKPKTVFFMSDSLQYRDYWLNIMKTEYVDIEGVLISKVNNQKFIICSHPTKHGVTQDYFNKVGMLAR